MGSPALDFTSALYLGLGHASASLRPWDQLTTGAPAALVEMPDAGAVAQRVAALQGCERGLLAPSTLHLFWDLFGALTGNGVAIYADVGVYPVVRWGVERAAARGVPVRGFAHHDPESLRRRLKLDARRGWRPLVVTDGFCPGCGGPAPVAEYLECARDYGGILVLDDTQALGVLGHSPESDAPYGKGGGGVLRWSDVAGPDLLVGSSLAKGFGAPVAALCGGRALIERFKIKSETRVHSSPPSVAAVRAAEHALAVNLIRGDAMRLRLARLVAHFRRRLAEIGVSTGGGAGGLFPVQTIAPGPDAATVCERLRRAGVRAVLGQGRSGRSSRLSFLLSARHHPDEIDYAIDALADAMREQTVRRIDWRKNERSIRL
jgi:8-amino-7-oxononanoate synthase